MTLDVNDADLKQLTGCDRAAILQLEVILRDALLGKRAGAPYRHSIRTMLVAALVKLRSGSAYRTISVHLGIPFVTLYRMTNLVCGILAKHPLFRPKDHDWLIVDVTCSRVRSTDTDDYSGYKHHRNRKVQVVVDNNRHIVAVSPAYSGKVHDKTIWNKEIGAVAPLLDRPTLADKAYAGAKSENVILFRPFKRNEKPYKTDRDGCKSYNRELSKIRVTVEHVFAQIKAYRIMRDIFPLRKDRYATVFRAIALIHNVNQKAF